MISWFLARLKGIFNTLASLVIFLVLVFAISALVGSFSREGLPQQTVLKLDLRKQISDSSSTSPFAAPRNSVIDIVAALAKAETDDRVKGVFIRVGGGSISMAQAEEIRTAIKAFRAKKKFAVTFAQAFYSGGMSEYYVATASDEIWLQPASEMNTSGFAATTLFFKGLLDKVNAKAEVGQRYEYKNAGNPFLYTDYTEAHKEATGRLIQSLFDNAVAGSAADRNMDAAAFKTLIDNAPYLTEAALKNKLIDRVGYDDEAEKAALDRASNTAKLVSIKDYLEKAGHPWKRAEMGETARIAFIAGDGTIEDGESDDGSFGSDSSIGGDTVANSIRKATEDKDIRVILFRVNSPGGSPLASDQILSAIKKAKAAKKKVIVSMGTVAASGGYYVSLAADKIFAWPSTITGSIGVVGGKLVTGGTYELVGINPRTLRVGQNAGMNSDFESYTPAQLAKRDASLDAIYEDFTSKVAEGRGLDVNVVRDFAKGRVWSGTDAMRLKLIDSYGGFRAALDEAKKEAGLKADETVYLKRFPAPMTPADALAKAFGTTTSVVETLGMMAQIMNTPGIREVIETLSTQAKQNEGARLEGPRQVVK